MNRPNVSQKKTQNKVSDERGEGGNRKGKKEICNTQRLESAAALNVNVVEKERIGRVNF